MRTLLPPEIRVLEPFRGFVVHSALQFLFSLFSIQRSAKLVITRLLMFNFPDVMLLPFSLFVLVDFCLKKYTYIFLLRF